MIIGLKINVASRAYTSENVDDRRRTMDTQDHNISGELKTGTKQAQADTVW